jgi:diguanylate cyclase (GGDEF)-like protein/PAS domain S-box-containing protein
MAWHFPPYLIITLFMAMGSFAMTISIWIRRGLAGNRFLAVLLGINTWWLITYLYELFARTAELKFFWHQAQYIAIATIPVAFLLFILAFTEHLDWLKNPLFWLVLIEPLLGIGLAFTNSPHRLVWADIELSRLDGYSYTEVILGPWSWFHLALAAGITVIGSTLVRQHAPYTPRVMRYQSQIISLSIAIVMLAVLVDLTAPSDFQGIKFTALAIILMAVILAIAIAFHRMQDILPLARDAILENMSDGVIVLDSQDRIIDLNQSASELLGRNFGDVSGAAIETIWSDLKVPNAVPKAKGEIVKEVLLTTQQGERLFDLRTSTILDAQGQMAGRLMVLRDITRQKQAEETAHRRDQILEAVSYAAEQFLTSTSWDQDIEEILHRLGEATKVSRVYLFENFVAQGRLFDRLRNEWVSEGIRPLIDIEELKKEDLIASGLQRWVELMSRGQAIYGRVRDLPQAEQTVLRREDVISIAVAPIFVSKQWWGYIGFDDCVSERAWSSVEMDALQAAASTMGAAIQRQRAEEELHQRTQIITTLLEVSEVIGSAMDISEVLDQIALAVHRLLPTDHVAIFLWDESEQALIPTLPTPSSGLKLALQGELLDSYKNLRLTPKKHDLVQELMENKRVIAISDVANNTKVPREMVQLFGIKSLLAAPILFQDRFTGALYLEFVRQNHEFTKEELDLATALARQAGLASERSRLYTQSKSDAAELAALYRASTQLLHPGRDLKELAEQITKTVVHEFASTVCSLWVLDNDTQTLKLLAQEGFTDGYADSLPLDGMGIVTAAARSGETIYVPDVSVDSRYICVNASTKSELAFPLRVGDWIIGAINLENSEPDGFNEQAQRILARYADNAALALQNVRLFKAAEIHANQLIQLNEVTRTAIGSANFKEMLQKLADQLVGIVGSDECFINLWDEDLQMVVPGAASGESDTLYQLTPAVQGESSMTRTALESGSPLFIADVHHSEYVSQRVSSQFRTKAALTLPMLIGELKLGAIIFGFIKPRELTSREILLCEQLADQVGLAISKAWALELSHQRAQEADNLRQATAAISSSLDLGQVLDSILTHLEPVVPYDSACVFLLEDEHLLAVAGRGFPNPEHILQKKYSFDDLYLETQKLNQPTIIIDAQGDPRFSGWGNTDYVRGWMGVPLRGRGTIIGYLTLDSRTVGAFNEHSATLAQAFAGQAAVAIENSRLFEAARQRAQEAETLRQAGAIVAATLKQEEATHNILEQLARVVSYKSASVQILNEGYLEIIGGVGWPGGVEKIIGMRFEIPGDNPNTIVIQHRQPYILGDAPAAYEGFKIMPHIASWMGVPLIFRERIIGMITVDSSEPYFFTLDHARLASAFADQVAIAIENARLFTAEQNRVRHLDALRATGADISAELEISRLLETILKRAIALLGATGGELGLHNQSSNTLEIVASINMGISHQVKYIEMGEGAMGLVAETLQPQIIDNYPKWEGRSNQYKGVPWKCAMVAPLMVHGRLVGTIGIVDEKPDRHFGTDDLGLLTMFAQQAAIAVENARLYQDARMAAERRSVLHRVSQEVVTASDDPEKIYVAIHRAASQLMPVDAFTITLLDEERDEIEAVYLIDQDQRSPALRAPKDQGLSGKVISTGQSIYINDFRKVQSWNGVHYGSSEHTRSILAVPLRSGDKVIGMISAQSYKPHAYSTEDQYLLEMLAAHAAIAILNTRLIEQIQWLAITDPLTGLYNRRGLFNLGEREVERFRRFGRPFVAIMIDIDLFKNVNDSYGHTIGDQVLVALSIELKKRVRDVDVIGRYGGEEIVILMPETDLASGYQAAERLRRYIAELDILTERGKVAITISMGVAEFRPHIPDLATLIDRADSAMYQAKQAGRNQVKGYR